MQIKPKSAKLETQKNDFNFMFGDWNVQHRKLKTHLNGCTDWDVFKGTSSTAPILNGYGNVEDNFLDSPAGAYRAVAIRSYDETNSRWAIWWLDHRVPHALDVPVVGQFNEDIGTFFAEDTLNNIPIKVRFTWQKGKAPVWKQAFSTDNGDSWETNWVMEFTKRVL